MANPGHFYPNYAPQPRHMPVCRVNSFLRCRGMDPSQTKIIKCFLFVLFAAAYGYFTGSIIAFVMYVLD